MGEPAIGTVLLGVAEPAACLGTVLLVVGCLQAGIAEGVCAAY